jgi:hypothetical protein
VDSFLGECHRGFRWSFPRVDRVDMSLSRLFTIAFETRWGSSSSFPTTAMKSRGNIQRMWLDVMIALPSGVALAVSVLDGNIGE